MAKGYPWCFGDYDCSDPVCRFECKFRDVCSLQANRDIEFAVERLCSKRKAGFLKWIVRTQIWRLKNEKVC